MRTGKGHDGRFENESKQFAVVQWESALFFDLFRTANLCGHLWRFFGISGVFQGKDARSICMNIVPNRRDVIELDTKALSALSNRLVSGDEITRQAFVCVCVEIGQFMLLRNVCDCVFAREER